MVSTAGGEQNRTYPTSATTQIRWDTYNDALSSISSSTFRSQVAKLFNAPVPPGIIASTPTWIMYGSSQAWFYNQPVSGYLASIKPGTTNYTVALSTFALLSAFDRVSYNTQYSDIMKIADSMEEYMVWPDTYTFPDDWRGWCLQIINKNNVPVVCP